MKGILPKIGAALISTTLRKHEKSERRLNKKFPSIDVNKIFKENKNYIRKRKRIDFTMEDLDGDTELQNNEEIEFKSSKLMLTNSDNATKRDVPKRSCTKTANNYEYAGEDRMDHSVSESNIEM